MSIPLSLSLGTDSISGSPGGQRRHGGAQGEATGHPQSTAWPGCASLHHRQFVSRLFHNPWWYALFPQESLLSLASQSHVLSSTESARHPEAMVLAAACPVQFSSVLLLVSLFGPSPRIYRLIPTLIIAATSLLRSSNCDSHSKKWRD